MRLMQPMWPTVLSIVHQVFDILAAQGNDLSLTQIFSEDYERERTL